MKTDLKQNKEGKIVFFFSNLLSYEEGYDDIDDRKFNSMF
jgi:hypothetical protein